MKSSVNQTTSSKQTDNNISSIPKNEATIEEQKFGANSNLYSTFSKQFSSGDNGVDSPINCIGVRDFSAISILPPQQFQLQPKLKINSPNDKYEQEADRVAEQVMRMPEPIVQRKCMQCGKEEEHLQMKSLVKNLPMTAVQRKCAKCQEDELIQTKSNSNSSSTVSPGLMNQIGNTKGSGHPLDTNTQAFMEPRFGADFSGVRIHSGDGASLMNQEINAKAFTVGSDIYFNNGMYNPQSGDGKRLLAHELTHTLQQSKTSIRSHEPASIEQKVKGKSKFIIDESTDIAAGQVAKSEFLQTLNNEICITVDQELEGTPFTSDNCPYLKRAFLKLHDLSSLDIENLLGRYEPGINSAQNVNDLTQSILVRVRSAVNQWKQKGSLSDVQENMSNLLAEIDLTTENVYSNGELNPFEELFFKANPGGSKNSQSPLAIIQSLGKGSPLKGSTRSKMEGAFGTDFSDVSIHTDSIGADMSSKMNARAFTVGKHIAFAKGEYQPGTLIGDVLMAHELAHVIQQRSALNSENSSTTKNNTLSLEQDANSTTFGAVLNLCGGIKGGIKNIKQRTKPALQSGLQIQRCQAAPALGLLGAGAGGTTAVVGGGTALTLTIGGVTLTATQVTLIVASAVALGYLTSEAYDALTEAIAAAEAAAAAGAVTIADCIALHTAYKAIECPSCKGTDTQEERAAKIACISAQILGREAYLLHGCDYILPGSISRGSSVAESGHRTQVEQLKRMLEKCTTLPTN